MRPATGVLIYVVNLLSNNVLCSSTKQVSKVSRFPGFLKPGKPKKPLETWKHFCQLTDGVMSFTIDDGRSLRGAVSLLLIDYGYVEVS